MEKQKGDLGGRPTTYNFEIAKEICMLTYEMSLTKACESDVRFPHRATFFRWKREHNELSDFYVKIVRDRGELLIEEMNDIMEALKLKRIEPSAANVLIQTLKWKAAKYYPKMFGDSSVIDVTSKGEKVSNVMTVKFVDGSDSDKEE